jgi:hypothetical protein
MQELSFKCRGCTVTVDPSEIVVTKLLNRQYTIRHNYDGTVAGMAKAVNTCVNLPDDDFKLFAEISKTELEELEEC